MLFEKTWLLPKGLIRIPWKLEVKLPKAIIVLRWVTFLALDFWCTLPPMVHPIIVEESRGLPWRAIGAGWLVRPFKVFTFKRRQ